MLKKIVKIRPLSSEKVTHIKTYTEMYIYTHTCTHSCRAIFALVYANCIVYRTHKHNRHTYESHHVHKICEQLGLK